MASRAIALCSSNYVIFFEFVRICKICNSGASVSPADISSLPIKWGVFLYKVGSFSFSKMSQIFCHSCGSCSYALKYFCDVELMALYAFLAGNDVMSFNVTPI